jgi:AraC-like DNA-binding protein
LSEDLSVDRLTEEFNISKNKLYNSVSKYMSVGIAKHIKNLRLEEAKRLLTETDMTIFQIADRVGFTDYNYFCRVFKKEVGVPAGKYRNNTSGHGKVTVDNKDYDTLPELCISQDRMLSIP